jgi:hypothetical protein
MALREVIDRETGEIIDYPVRGVERRTDEEALARIGQHLVHRYVYEIEVWNSRERRYMTQQSLTQAGVVAIAGAMGGLVVSLPVWERDDAGVTCTVPATDQAAGLTVYGCSYTPFWTEGQDGRRFENRNAHAAALGRAQRNALRQLLSPGVVDQVIAWYLESPKRPPPPQRQGGGKRQAQPSAEEQAEIDRLMARIEEASPEELNRQVRAEIAGAVIREKTGLWSAFHARGKALRDDG